MTHRAMRARETALTAAVTMHAAINGDLTLRRGIDRQDTITDAENEIRSTADLFAAWLIGTTRISFTRGPVTDQTTGQPTGTTNEGVPVQIHDNEKFDLTVATKDAKGFDTADQIDWAVDDDTVVTLNVSPDGRTCTVVAGNPGSAVITVTDNAVDPALSATEAVDVVTGGTATITFTEGPVTLQ